MHGTIRCVNILTKYRSEKILEYPRDIYIIRQASLTLFER